MSAFDMLAREYAAEITARCKDRAETGELPGAVLVSSYRLTFSTSCAPNGYVAN